MATLIGRDTESVFDAFLTGIARFRDRAWGRRRIWTDGTRIYSYGMVIAERRDGALVLNESAYQSTMTTRRHVRAVQALAERASMTAVVAPLRSL